MTGKKVIKIDQEPGLLCRGEELLSRIRNRFYPTGMKPQVLGFERLSGWMEWVRIFMVAKC